MSSYVPLRRHWVFRLKRSCNIAGTYRETSLRRCYDVLLSGGFSLAHSMIENFSNWKRAAPMHRSSKKSKGESFSTGSFYWVFCYSRSLHCLFVQEDWELQIYLLLVLQCPTVCPEKKNCIVYITVKINRNTSWIYQLFGILLNNNAAFCFRIKNKISSNFTTLFLEKSKYWKDFFYIYWNLLTFSTIYLFKKSI